MRCDFTFNSQAAADACGESVYNYHLHVIMCERSGMIFTMSHLGRVERVHGTSVRPTCVLLCLNEAVKMRNSIVWAPWHPLQNSHIIPVPTICYLGNSCIPAAQVAGWLSCGTSHLSGRALSVPSYVQALCVWAVSWDTVVRVLWHPSFIVSSDELSPGTQ